MAFLRSRLFVQILVMLPVIALCDTKHKVEKDTDETCIDPARPYQILSVKDKKRLEQIIKAHGTKDRDPNINVP